VALPRLKGRAFQRTLILTLTFSLSTGDPTIAIDTTFLAADLET
jgi:hypothetical protein